MTIQNDNIIDLNSIRQRKNMEYIIGPHVTEDEIMCNLCGLSCMLGHEKEFYQNYGLLNQRVIGGYHSTPTNGYGTLVDMMTYTFSLCEFCLDFLFSKFKNPVIVKDYYTHYEEIWKNAEEKWNEADKKDKTEVWRCEMKKKFFEELEKRNNARNVR